MKYQNLDFAEMGSDAKMDMRKRGGFGSFSVGIRRPTILYSFSWNRIGKLGECRHVEVQDKLTVPDALMPATW